mgnify:CR=1 FL=1
MTDNRNRTVAEVRHAFNKHGGNLGTDGSVAYMFNKKGIMSYGPGADEDAIMEAALEAGADDVVGNDDGSVDVYTTPEDFSDVLAAMEGTGHTPDNAEVTFEADTGSELDQDGAEKLMRLVDFLEDLDDVQEVYHNGDISPEIMDALDA